MEETRLFLVESINCESVVESELIPVNDGRTIDDVAWEVIAHYDHTILDDLVDQDKVDWVEVLRSRMNAEIREIPKDEWELYLDE